MHFGEIYSLDNTEIFILTKNKINLQVQCFIVESFRFSEISEIRQNPRTQFWLNVKESWPLKRPINHSQKSMVSFQCSRKDITLTGSEPP